MKISTIGLSRHPKHLKGAKTWFQHPPILLRVRLQSALYGLMLKGPVVSGFVWLNNFELGSSPLKPTTLHMHSPIDAMKLIHKINTLNFGFNIWLVMTISTWSMLLYRKVTHIKFIMHNIFQVTNFIESFVLSKTHRNKLTPSYKMFLNSRGWIIGARLNIHWA